jgi:hypothetical protein
VLDGCSCGASSLLDKDNSASTVASLVESSLCKPIVTLSLLICLGSAPPDNGGLRTPRDGDALHRRPLLDGVGWLRLWGLVIVGRGQFCQHGGLSGREFPMQASFGFKLPPVNSGGEGCADEDDGGDDGHQGRQNAG